ncbi:MAG: hypothetical protein IKU30_04780, partial [Clostridia bacterium]|nr:hypothetical protein [Clostridia bacterium]
ENLLFGSGKSTASAETVKGSSLITDNSNSNNIYINGMTISREVAENYTVAELFEAMPQLQN